MTNKKHNFIVEFNLDTTVEAEFKMTIKDALDIEDALFKAKDAARSVLNLTCYDDAPVVKSVTQRGW